MNDAGKQKNIKHVKDDTNEVYKENEKKQDHEVGK